MPSSHTSNIDRWSFRRKEPALAHHSLVFVSLLRSPLLRHVQQRDVFPEIMMSFFNYSNYCVFNIKSISSCCCYCGRAHSILENVFNFRLLAFTSRCIILSFSSPWLNKNIKPSCSDHSVAHDDDDDDPKRSFLNLILMGFWVSYLAWRDS